MKLHPIFQFYHKVVFNDLERNYIQWRIQGGAPPDQNFLNFMQFFGKIWQICKLAPPPTRNPGSAPDIPLTEK